VGLGLAPGLFCCRFALKVRVGWTLGGGLEWALNNNWSVKGEYLYANLGKQSFTSSFTGPNPPPAWTISHSAKWDSLQIIRLGLNYRFGGPAESVVAKY
jgi:outer membrane immunogenic protein